MEIVRPNSLIQLKLKGNSSDYSWNSSAILLHNNSNVYILYSFPFQ